MAANFWESSHCNFWLIDRTTLDKARAVDLNYASQRQIACLGIYFANHDVVRTGLDHNRRRLDVLQRLGKRLALRQRPVATAIVYMRRFYLKNSYCETDPYLVLATCIYVAAKLEETPVHIKSVIGEARALFLEDRINIKHFPSDNTKLAEMEFYLLEDLDFHLTVFHPYRSLAALCGKSKADTGTFPTNDPVDGETEEDVQLGRGTGRGAFIVDNDIFNEAWFMINDTYRTDLCLLYPPHLIAVACLYLAISHFQTIHPGRSILAGVPQAGAVSSIQQPLPPSVSLVPPSITPLSTSPRPRATLPNPTNHPLPMNPLNHPLPQRPGSGAATAFPGMSPYTASTTPTMTPGPAGMQTSKAKSTDPTDIFLAYLSNLNVSFPQVAIIAQEMLSLWPLWATVDSSVAPPTSAGLTPIEPRLGGGQGVSIGPEMVALVERMRTDRERDISANGMGESGGGWPVQGRGGGGNVAGRGILPGGTPVALGGNSGVKRSRN